MDYFIAFFAVGVCASIVAVNTYRNKVYREQIDKIYETMLEGRKKENAILRDRNNQLNEEKNKLNEEVEDLKRALKMSVLNDLLKKSSAFQNDNKDIYEDLLGKARKPLKFGDEG